MSEKTNIAWCDSTFNPWVGCQKISPACDHCYAETWAKRGGKAAGVTWGAGQPRRRTSAANWNKPLLWQRRAAAANSAWRAGLELAGVDDAELQRRGFIKPRRPRVFCASLADVFDNEVPVHWRWDLFRLIAATPGLDWLLLTKRIGNARGMLNDAASAVAGEFVGAAEWDRAPWSNVWIGTTVCNQAEADRDIPKLLQVPAARRFLSIEPMLGPIDMSRWLPAMRWAKRATTGEPFQVPHYYMAHCKSCGWIGTSEWLLYVSNGDDGECYCPECDRLAEDEIDGLDWVICGGESGPQARPMHPDWARSLRDQCAAAGVPFFMKQMGGARDKRGALEDLPEDLRVRGTP